MKTISKIICSGILAGATLLSCERDLTSLNADPKHPSVLPSANLLATGQYQSFYHIYNPNVHSNNFRFFTQQLSQTTYIDETQYDLVTRDQPRRYFNALYVNSINNLKSAKKFLSQEANSSQAVANNKWAILEISEIFIF